MIASRHPHPGLVGLCGGGLLLGGMCGALLSDQWSVTGPFLVVALAALTLAASLWFGRARFGGGTRGEADAPLEEAFSPPSNLLSAARRYQSYFECTPGALFVEDRHARIEDVNREAEYLTGRSHEDLLGRPFSDIIPPSSRRDGDGSDPMVWDAEVEAPDGGRRRLRVHEGLLYGSDGPRRQYLVQDVTEELRVAALRRRDETMDALARLAGPVAHDLNNQLTAVLGYGQMLQLAKDDPEKSEKYVDEVLRAGARASALTGQLAALGRRGPFDVAPADLDDLIHAWSADLEEIPGPEVDLEFHLAGDLPDIPLAEERVHELLRHLVQNACEAMPNGGTCRVETAHAAASAEGCGGVVLSVTDTGSGVPEEIRPFVFEPYATTKEEPGAGMGLAHAYAIARRHGGSLEMLSAGTSGTIVRVLLPEAVASTQWARDAAAKTAASNGRQRRTVLVLDDNDAVLGVTVRCLKRLGYETIAASRREEALERIRNHDGRIDLILSDIVMPGMDAEDFARRIDELLSDAGWVYMTGYADREPPVAGRRGDRPHLLRKPFTQDALGRSVREALAGRPPASPSVA
ncbi:MAG: hybrid sensor histidine kinase/response regulator [Planctomycetota bacterium]